MQCTDIAFKKAAGRLARKGRIVRIHSGFFVIVPLEYATTRTLPPEWFISDLMAYLDQPYYVGLLSAASLQGAAHQQPQQFQVVTIAPLREIRKGALSIRFFTKAGLANTPVNQIKVETGMIPVSTPEATALDLVRYAKAVGGVSRVFTVLQELGEAMNAGKLMEAAETNGELAHAQRLGWFLEKAGFQPVARGLATWVSERSPVPTRLEPSLPVRGARRDERWRVLVNIDAAGDL
jgi:predicted transcriptional regulator of viral defense system